MPRNPYEKEGLKDFVSLSPWLLFEMTGLSLNAWKLFSLLVKRIDRVKGRREPTKKSNPFKISPKGFKLYGMSKESFYRGIKELAQKGFIKIAGKRNARKCKLLKW